MQQATTFAPFTIMLGHRYCGNALPQYRTTCPAGRLARGGGEGVPFPLKFSLRQGHGVRSLSNRLDQGGSEGGGPVTFESLGLRPELLEAVKKLGNFVCLPTYTSLCFPHNLSLTSTCGCQCIYQPRSGDAHRWKHPPSCIDFAPQAKAPKLPSHIDHAPQAMAPVQTSSRGPYLTHSQASTWWARLRREAARRLCLG